MADGDGSGDTEVEVISTPPKFYVVPPNLKDRLAKKKRWWEGITFKGACTKCKEKETLVIPQKTPLKFPSEGLFIKGCLQCGHREEVDEWGEIPPRKNAYAQTSEEDFEWAGAGVMWHDRNTATL